MIRRESALTMAVNQELVAQAEPPGGSGRLVLYMDSTESSVHSQQEGSAHNGHFPAMRYHPLLLLNFNQHRGRLAAELKPRNVHSVED